MTGVELTKTLKQRKPEAKILALTMYEDYQYVEKMIRNGARGYILKNSILKELTRAITCVAKNKKYMGEEIQEVLFNKIGTTDTEDYIHTGAASQLSPREKEILTLIVNDFNKSQIAEKLCISERTVETHRKNMFAKTGVNTVVGMIRYAVQHNIVSLD